MHDKTSNVKCCCWNGSDDTSALTVLWKVSDLSSSVVLLGLLFRQLYVVLGCRSSFQGDLCSMSVTPCRFDATSLLSYSTLSCLLKREKNHHHGSCFFFSSDCQAVLFFASHFFPFDCHSLLVGCLTLCVNFFPLLSVTASLEMSELSWIWIHFLFTWCPRSQLWHHLHLIPCHDHDNSFCKVFHLRCCIKSLSLFMYVTCPWLEHRFMKLSSVCY